MATTIDNGQTCLEKRGFEKRKELLAINLDNDGYIQGSGTEYSVTHPNAVSERHKVKGKGSLSGGHTYFSPYFGLPKENVNEINYSNFDVFSDKTRTVGGEIDIDKRYESELTKRYSYDNNEYSESNEDAISNGYVHGKGTGIYLDTNNGGGGYDVRSRDLHLLRNSWQKDLPYTKLLVQSEYEIQTEFKINSTEATIEEQEEAAKKKQEKAAEKDRIKAEKKAEKEKRKAEKEAKKAQGASQEITSETRTAPVETTLTPEMQMAAAMQNYLGEQQTSNTMTEEEYFKYMQRFAPNQ